MHIVMMLYKSYNKVISFCTHHLFHTSLSLSLSSSSALNDRIITTFLSLQPHHHKITTLLKSIPQYHAYIITTGHHSSNVFISSKLISLYSYLNNPLHSQHVFHSFHGHKDIFIWNSYIKSYFSNGFFVGCLEIYYSMRVLGGLVPNHFTLPMVVSSCAEVKDYVSGVCIHGLVFKVGVLLTNSAAVGSSFVYMYFRCGEVGSARKVFDEMCVRDVVAWTALVIGYVQNGEPENGLRCVSEMFRIGEMAVRPNFRTLEGGFQACGDLEAVSAGRCLHGVAVKSGLGCLIDVQSSIVSMYSKCGSLEESSMSFIEVPVKDIKLWTSIIVVYGRRGCVKECIGGFMEMLVSGIDPDPMLISCVLSGLANSASISAGKTFHGFMIRRNYDQDQMVHNALVSMYCNIGLITYAENVFNNLCILDNEIWNSMVHGYSKVGCGVKCIELLIEMLNVGIHPDSYSLVSVISSCSQMDEINLGRSLHGYAVKRLMKEEHVSVSNALIDMYTNNGDLQSARKLFCRTDKDIITWNTMISACTHLGHYDDAFSLFSEMALEGIKPTAATLISMLSACGRLVSVERGEEILKYIDQEMLFTNVTLATALVDMYAKCGQLEQSKNIFKDMTKRDIISWNVMIAGYGMHGDAISALDTFRMMELSDIKPNELTFLAVLSACNHAGLVNEGKSLFARMRDYSLKPALKHYTCLVDLLGRSGNLLEAENLVLSMPTIPDGGLWGALLSACKTHNNAEMGIRIAKRAIQCDPDNDGYYITISNLYDSIGMCEEAERIRNFMKERGIEKAVGWSAV